MRRYVAVLGALVLLAGCGGNPLNPTPTHKTSTLVAARCQHGASYMGCARDVGHYSLTAKPKGARGLLAPLRAPGGGKIPDVSSYQGHPAWGTARPYIVGGIAKAGEYVQDPDFVYNWTTLRALGLWHSSYWFVRNTGCSHEAAQYIAVLRSVGYQHDALAGPPVLDMEVGEAYGYALCMANALHSAFGVWAVVYTAPGTWPGGPVGGLQAWPAAYGPNSPPCLPFTCSHYVAFQFAAPPWVNFYVPGLGYQDESVNYTFTSLRPFAKPTPPRVRCFGPHAQLRLRYCQTIRAHVKTAVADIAYVRYTAAFRNGCLRRFPTPKNGHYVRWGPNYHRNFCVRLRSRVAADILYVRENRY